MMGGPPMGGPGGMRGGPGLREKPPEAEEERGFGFRAIQSLTIPAYRMYFLFVLGQMGAMNMQMIARSWFVFELTDSVSMLGLVALANAVPMISLSLFGGVLADRLPKKQVLIVGQFASTVITLGVAVSITVGSVTWVHLIVASFLQGIVMAMMMPARQAIIPELVGAKMITNAVALNGAAMNLLRLMGPALAGLLIALWDIEGVYYIMAVLYGTGVFVLMGLPLSGSVALRGQGMIKQVKEGLSYIKHNAAIRTLLFFTLFSFVLSMPYMFLLPAFTDETLTVDPSRLTFFTSIPVIGGLVETLDNSAARQGFLISISGIGALVGSIFVATMRDKRRGFYLLISMLVMAVTLIIFSFTNSFLVAMLVFIPLGFAQSGRMALSNTLAQVYTEDEYRGRVMSIYMLNWGFTNVGVFVVGILADATTLLLKSMTAANAGASLSGPTAAVFDLVTGFTGAQLAVGISSILLLLVTLYFTFFVKRIRQLD